MGNEVLKGEKEWQNLILYVKIVNGEWIIKAA